MVINTRDGPGRDIGARALGGAARGTVSADARPATSKGAAATCWWAIEVSIGRDTTSDQNQGGRGADVGPTLSGRATLEAHWRIVDAAAKIDEIGGDTFSAPLEGDGIRRRRSCLQRVLEQRWRIGWSRNCRRVDARPRASRSRARLQARTRAPCVARTRIARLQIEAIDRLRAGSLPAA